MQVMQDHGNYGTASGPLATEPASSENVHNIRVILFTCFLCLVVVAEGYDLGVLNGAMVRMKDDLGISMFQISLVVTATPLFVMPGAVVGGAMADEFGRRCALRVCCILLALGPVGTAMSSSVSLLFSTRAIVGFGIGMGFVIVSMYIAELSPMAMRGRLTTLEEVFLNIGIVTGYMMNWLLLGIENDWRWMLALGSALPLIVLIAVCLPQMPESPRWLVSKGYNAEAEKVLTYFVSKEEVERDMQAMGAQLQQDQEFVTWKEVLCSWHDIKIRRMLIAGIVVAVAQMGCGYLPISYYSSTVLKATMSERAAFMATTVMGIVKLLVTLVTLAVLERVGRRPMLLASASVCGLACAWLGVAFSTNAGGFIQAFGFALFAAGFSLGLGPITFVYVSEAFVTRWRAKAMAFSLFVSRVVGATSTMVFPSLIAGIGVSACFWIMAVINVLLVGLMSLFVFETHGRSLERMEDLYEEPAKAESKSP